MASPKVIVFGPTGAVGSAAARTANSLHSPVTLAMRDPSKDIPGLPFPTGQTTTGTYTKVQADLTDPSTVSAAVAQSGAKHAFLYLVHNSQDHMKSTIQALKDSGITLVVFLSSFTVTGTGVEALSEIQPQSIIDYLHAQVEINLENIFGRQHFVAVRPGSFASNELQYKSGFEKGDVKITFPKSKIDCIVPEDIGRVSGTVLAKGAPEDGNHAIYLYGPQFISAHESVATIARVLGKSPKVSDCEEGEARKILIEERGYPPPLADYFMAQTKTPGGPDELFGKKVNPADRGNVKKYSGFEATTFEEWVRENQENFTS